MEEMMVFLTAPMSLQQSPAYERALESLRKRHGLSEVSADRDLFSSFKYWKKNYKEVYSKAEIIYVLAREDGTVGLGVYKQCRFADKKGIPQVLMFADEQGELAGTGEYEEFGLELLNADGKEEPDLGRFALAKL